MAVILGCARMPSQRAGCPILAPLFHARVGNLTLTFRSFNDLRFHSNANKKVIDTQCTSMLFSRVFAATQPRTCLRHCQLLAHRLADPIRAVTFLESTLMRSPASVANKELTGPLNPLHATLTKNTGVGSVMVNQLFCKKASFNELLYFQSFMHSFPQRESLRSFLFSGFRTLSVATGDVGVQLHSSRGSLRIRPGQGGPLFRFHRTLGTGHESPAPILCPKPDTPSPLPYAYNCRAIPPPLCPGDRSFAPSWRSS